MKASLLSICLAVTISNTFGQVKSNSNLKAILTGNWITTAYLKELKATLSPHKAQINTKLALQLFIDIKPADKTSTVTDMWTLHEGGYGFSIYFKPGVKKGTFKTNFVDYDHPGTAFSDIGYEVIEKECVGCNLCALVCPVECITVVPQETGLPYLPWTKHPNNPMRVG